ncbi:MAG TPA: DUF1573 domain-containing protein [Bacteroidia bacterium]|nr:DUF1573 domain-containing protein [Bacteroidia bacterium]
MKKTILLVSMFIAFTAASQAQNDKATPPTPTPATPATIAPAPAPTAAPVQDNPNAADFKFEKEEYNFGTIKQGDNVEFDFTFVNSGKEPLVITDAHGSCGCTVPTWPKEPIKKGEKGAIHVKFNSAGKMGMQDKTVTLNSNAKSNPKVLHLKGTVEAPPATATDQVKPAEQKPAETPKN